MRLLTIGSRAAHVNYVLHSVRVPLARHLCATREQRARGVLAFFHTIYHQRRCLLFYFITKHVNKIGYAAAIVRAAVVTSDIFKCNLTTERRKLNYTRENRKRAARVRRAFIRRSLRKI